MIPGASRWLEPCPATPAARIRAAIAPVRRTNGVICDLRFTVCRRHSVLENSGGSRAVAGYYGQSIGSDGACTHHIHSPLNQRRRSTRPAGRNRPSFTQSPPKKDPSRIDSIRSERRYLLTTGDPDGPRVDRDDPRGGRSDLHVHRGGLRGDPGGLPSDLAVRRRGGDRDDPHESRGDLLECPGGSRSGRAGLLCDRGCPRDDPGRAAGQPTRCSPKLAATSTTWLRKASSRGSSWRFLRQALSRLRRGFGVAGSGTCHVRFDQPSAPEV